MAYSKEFLEIYPLSLSFGVYVDTDLSMCTHALKTTSGCFAVLRRIKSIQWSVSTIVLQSLMAALVT